jgi:hypothetical protein
MKGSPWRRLVGSASSRRQAAQGARSATSEGAIRPMLRGAEGSGAAALILRPGSAMLRGAEEQG